MERLDKFLKYSDEKTLIVTFLNIKYYPIFKIWYKYFRRYKLTNLLVISLDKKIHKVLNNLKIRNILLPVSGFESFISEKIFDFEESDKLRKLWLLRGLVFKKIIDENVNIIHCDSDAFWIKNIYPLIGSLQCDINISVNSSGCGKPKIANRKWKFNLCNGFYMVRSNPRTKVFVEKYWELLRKIGNAQYAMNLFFLQNNIGWKKKSNIENEGYVRKLGLTVKAISSNLVSRSVKAGAYIYHPYLKGDINKKLKFVKENIKKVETDNKKAV